MMRSLLAALAVFVSLSPAVRAADAARRPNLVFVYTDDQRWAAMSVQSARTLAGHGRGPHDRDSGSALKVVKSTRVIASDHPRPVPVASARGVKPRIPDPDPESL